MTERRDGVPDDPGTPEPEETLPDLGADEPVVESDILEDISATEPLPAVVPPMPSAPDPPPQSRRPMRPDERRAARRPTAAPAPRPSEQAVHIEDRASRVLVLAAIAIFTLILLNALLAGQGGMLDPDPSPTPVPSATPSPPASSSPSASPSASPSGSTSPSPSPSPSASGSSPAGSAATSPSPTSSAAPS